MITTFVHVLSNETFIYIPDLKQIPTYPSGGTEFTPRFLVWFVLLDAKYV